MPARGRITGKFNERTIGETHVSLDERGSTRRATRATAVAHLTKFPGGVQPMPAEAEFAHFVEDVTVEFHGTFAVVQYRRDTRIQRRARSQTVPLHRSVQAGSRQLAVPRVSRNGHPGRDRPARVDPKVYDDYVGRYQLFAGYVYTITAAATG
jgi:hypothetical protein